MNIFLLDTSPKLAAQYHANCHAVKMVLETGQILSTVHAIYGSGVEGLYKPTHKNHPCVKWAALSKENYEWTVELFRELSKEYTYRYGKDHASFCRLDGKIDSPPNGIPSLGFTQPAQAMPDEYRNVDPVVAYRNYYKFGKTKLLKYTKREVPEWLGQIPSVNQT